jgi:hypothetical protein
MGTLRSNSEVKACRRFTEFWAQVCPDVRAASSRKHSHDLHQVCTLRRVSWRRWTYIQADQFLQLRPRQTPAITLIGQIHKNAMQRVSRGPDHFGVVKIHMLQKYRDLKINRAPFEFERDANFLIAPCERGRLDAGNSDVEFFH